MLFLHEKSKFKKEKKKKKKRLFTHVRIMNKNTRSEITIWSERRT